ncbi:Alginate export [Reichenbachiella agariperforans]|uniref:Alginate export n=1 Tax=Reichenbachiella agariperforans TaxID=156994 RepID=A0A1M6LQJ2_REIAG|nr:alginate export family protein [Reichenbachiella agariperforans]SHJ73459.1 Alginate export [Reichenbachiella agariperforans]
MKYSKLWLVALAMSFSSYLQAQFIIDAQVRPRAEFRNGFKELNAPDEGPAFYTEQRTRLSVGFTQEKYKIKVTVQDVRMWGSTNQPYKTDDNNTLHFSEAWGQYFFTDKLSFKAGRQIIRYHNERFFGSSNWQPQGRSHDALLLIYEDLESGWKIDIGGAFNQNAYEPSLLQGTFYDGVVNYKHMEYVWLTKRLEKLEINAMALNNGYQNVTDSSGVAQQSFALLLDYKVNDRLKIGGESYLQMGKNRAGVDNSAHMLAAYATYKTDMTPIKLAVDYMSGTSYGSSKDHSFNSLFGSNHKFYGYMDYFYVANPHRMQGTVYNTGLLDFRIMTEWKTGANSSLKANIHQFFSPVDIVDINDVSQSYSSNLGTEIDLVMTWKLDPAVTINLGYSQMFATESMEQIKGTVTGYTGEASALNNWAWVMVDFRPQLFNSSKKD